MQNQQIIEKFKENVFEVQQDLVDQLAQQDIAYQQAYKEWKYALANLDVLYEELDDKGKQIIEQYKEAVAVYELHFDFWCMVAGMKLKKQLLEIIE